MEGQLPDALMHIISNSEYYSASLYHHATQLVVNFIYQVRAIRLTFHPLYHSLYHVSFVSLRGIVFRNLRN